MQNYIRCIIVLFCMYVRIIFKIQFVDVILAVSAMICGNCKNDNVSVK